MDKDCLQQKLQVEKRTQHGSIHFVYTCINRDCQKECDRERLPTLQEREAFR